MKRYFITGTDTDCGKTWVTGKLVNHFAHSAAIKPIASGCFMVGDQLVSADAQHLQHHSNLPLEMINPWRYKLPVSPHIAAREEGQPIVVSHIIDYCLNLQVPGVETLFIEGAGGLIVPLNENETWIDFLKSSEIPVILVVGMKLGCINHALLTEASLIANKIKCVGWIANCLDPDMLALSENIETLKKKMNIPLLASLSYAGALIDINLQLI
jgi:dethiobiotin synthetase